MRGETKGYRSHPQLTRFKSAPDSVGAIANYLRHIYEEALRRGYRFDEAKMAVTDFEGEIIATRGQLLSVWNHLREKLKLRDILKDEEVRMVAEPKAHPLFKMREGEVEAWEVLKEPS